MEISVTSNALTTEGEEETAIRQRLLIKETALKRVAKKFTQIQNFWQTNQLEENLNLFNTLLKEIEIYESSSISKNALLYESTERQDLKYKHLCTIREKEILKAQSEINVLKEELQKERIVRKNKEEYEALAVQINELPSIEETQQVLMQLEEEAEKLKKESDMCSTKEELRKKQFTLLLYSIHQLEQQIKDEKYDQTKQLDQVKKDQIKLQEQVKKADLKPDQEVSEINNTEMNSDETQEDVDMQDLQ